MKQKIYLIKLMKIFNQSFINSNNELILVPETNLYICLNDIKTKLDIKCKLLEWCSRDAIKAQPYTVIRKNDKYQRMIRENINKYLGTNFSYEDMQTIYQYLGNAINHKLTIKFVESGYNFEILEVAE